MPCPVVRRDQVLISSIYTLVSTGTERMLVDFGKASYLEKARQQPDKVKQVLDKVKTDGLLPTLKAVRSKLDQPLPLGYCNAGVVLESGAEGFAPGDRVVSNGNHAEVVRVPKNLCAKIPDDVDDESAAFTVLAAIGLQGIRLINPTLGEAVVVSGLGLIGLMTVQMLRANGCRVLGIDFDTSRCEMARQFGAEAVDLSKGEDPIAISQSFSRGRGVDAVVITASTKSSEPVHQAALMCRKRGHIVLVGVTGLELSRADFFEKELTFQVSCSYGPGRYDSNYEEKGFDYPVGFVRWTEQRNFEAVLDMMAVGTLDVKPLISHRFEIDDAVRAYEVMGGAEPSLGILLQYPTASQKPEVELRRATVEFSPHPQPRWEGEVASVSFIGAGNYATAVLIPAFISAGAQLRCVASSGGVNGVHAGRKFGFDETTTDTEKLFSDTDSNTVVITTRHDSHARFVLKALAAGKHVFVEKPLCLTMEELAEIEAVCGSRPHTPTLSPDGGEGAKNDGGLPLVMVGFNRRFAPHVQKIKTLLSGVSGPKAFVMTVNAGAIPADHWTQDPAVGGGRIIGEACHFIDLLRFLADVPIARYQFSKMDMTTGDTASIQLEFNDGSIGTVHYFANGNKAYPKERLEVFAASRVLQLDNFRKLTGFGWPGFRKMNLWRQDKGQKACASAFVQAIEEGGPAPIPFEELIEVSRISVELVQGN